MSADKSIFSRLDTSFMRSTKTPGTQENIKRASYPKKTYNLHPDVIDMLEEIKRKLERHYAIKVSREEIVEAAIREACTDFQHSQETSKLVLQFTRNPEYLKPSFLETQETRNLALDSKLIVLSIIGELTET